ncbi:MAG: hypothetical protein JNN00_13910 [Chitinophagaceae bacterium]|nr:hypothetical protein [Chitinophagaceae bacterium]
MNQRIPIPVYIVSALLLLYLVLLTVNAPLIITGLLFSISPFLVIWMVIAVLRSKTFTGKDLQEDEDWGYTDKNKEDLGMF